MESFKVGSTYIANGFSNYGSIVKVKVLGRSEQTVKLGCDVLFCDNTRKRIRHDEDGNEMLILSKGFTLNAADIDGESRRMNEALSIQHAIMDSGRKYKTQYGDIQDLVIEETDDGIRFENCTKYQPAPLDLTSEEWTLDQQIETIPVKVVQMCWGEGCDNYPTELVVYLPKDSIESDNEGEAVMHAVFDAMRAKGFFYHPDEINLMNLIGYDLKDCPMCYDFDPADEIGLGGGCDFRF